jgi:hypothetical protein
LRVLLLSFTTGVGHPAKHAAWFNVTQTFAPLGRVSFSGSLGIRPPLPSLAPAVGHPVEALSDVRRPDAVCAQYGVPAGVAFCFQVALNKVDPLHSVRNLLTKDDARSSLARKP